jgi:hypothetical protein
MTWMSKVSYYIDDRDQTFALVPILYIHRPRMGQAGQPGTSGSAFRLIVLRTVRSHNGQIGKGMV